MELIGEWLGGLDHPISKSLSLVAELHRNYRANGYTVDFISHSAVRYREGERSITFSSEPLDRLIGSGKANWVVAVYVHRPLKWDEPYPSEITDPAEEDAILSRVQTALKSKIGKYELIAQP